MEHDIKARVDANVNTNVNTFASRQQIPMENSGEPPKTVTVPRHAASEALRLSEDAVSRLTDKLREAEQERENMIRRLCCLQDRVESLRRQIDVATRHHRAIFAAVTQ